MTGLEFVSIVQLLVSIMNQMFTMMDTVNIVSTSPRLSVYGLVVFLTFFYMTADFISEIRSA